MDLHQLITSLSELINFFDIHLIDIMFLIPFILQFIGILGLLYYGIGLLHSYKWQINIRKLVRSTMIWLIGSALNQIVSIYYVLI